MLNYYYSGAGIGLGNPDVSEIHRIISNCPNRLLSCHGEYTSFAIKWLNIAKEIGYKATILLDSGAFTAWSRGAEVQLEELITAYDNMLNSYLPFNHEFYLINLDKIPGSPGRTADTAEVEHCVKVSDYNFEILRKRYGERVLPVFHQNETETRLQEVISMAPYICVSPRNDVPEKSRVAWSKEVHAKIPKHIKTHGLATTGMKMMTQVEWYSVDSAAWIFMTTTGSILLCIGGKLKMIGISERSSARFEYDYHYRTVTKEVQEEIDKRLEFHGLTIEQLNNNLNSRILITILETNHWLSNNHTFIDNNHAGLFDL